MGQCFPIWLVMVNIKMAHTEIGLPYVDRIQLAENRNKWRSPLNMVLNMHVSKIQLLYQLAQQMLVS